MDDIEIEEVSKPKLIEDLGMMYPTESSKKKYRYGIYECGFCGTHFKAQTSDVNARKTKSCGCLKGLNHMESCTRLYRIFQSIKQRTTNPNSTHYKTYGGRGITMCIEWRDNFINFREWALKNGYSDELTIDRIDVNGNYEPSNCRWATKSVQSINRRLSKLNTSGYRGVSYKKSIAKFKASIKVNGVDIFLGYFKTAIEGAIAYNNHIIDNCLKYYPLNTFHEK